MARTAELWRQLVETCDTFAAKVSRLSQQYALGTAAYYLAAGERLGVHPLLRLVPPRALSRFAPHHVLCGHGEGIHGDEAAPALDKALATARRRLPALWRYGWRRAKGDR